ncbi:inhibitor-3 [Perilla frutescens var. hirtella]|nr:inhibitor-3 [Perilla frutescens var. hirtella]
MARPTSSRQSIAAPSTVPATATRTTTVALETASSSNQQAQIRDSLVLKLKVPKKKVSWKEGTVDNEFMNKKSSKKCCIFHKEKPFDEDDSDAEGDCDHDHDHHHHIDGIDIDDKGESNHGDDGNCSTSR